MLEILLDDKSYSEYHIKETECEGVVIRLRDGRFGALILDREKIIFSSTKRPDRFWGPPSPYSVSTGGSSRE